MILTGEHTVQQNKAQNLERINHDYKNADIYKELIVCSNTLIDTKHILSTNDGWHPLVIRKGIEPKVWLSVRVQDQPQEDNESKKDDEFIELISDSTVRHPAVVFSNSEYGFQVLINNQIVVEAGNHKDDSIEVIKLDLRPLGMNIYGDHLSLNLGNNSMSRNTSAGGNSMFGID